MVRERYGREAMTSAFRILGEGQLALTKFLFVTDGRIDLHDFPPCSTHVLERTHPETDLFVFANLAMDTLDYTGPEVNAARRGSGSASATPVRDLPREFRPPAPPPSEVTECASFSPGCLVIGGPSYADRARSAARPPRRASGLRRLAAAGAHRRAAARGSEPDELPLDDLHPLRAGGRPPRRRARA